MPKSVRTASSLCLMFFIAFGMVGCGGEAASPQAGVRSVPAEPTKPARQRREREKLSDEEWKKMAENADAELQASQKQLESTADDVEKNFDRIRQDLEAGKKKAAEDQAKADKEAFDKFDAATQQKPKSAPASQPNRSKP